MAARRGGTDLSRLLGSETVHAKLNPVCFRSMTAGEASWAERYRQMRPLYERLRAEVVFNLETSLRARQIKTHSVTARVKDEASFLEKIERKSYKDPFLQAPDLVGARVVCLFLEDLPKVQTMIGDLFEIEDQENKITDGPVEEFGYMSVHYVCRLHSGHAGPRYDDLKGLSIEIQCRTLLMDAWANVSHYLGYKGEASIPEHLQKDFHALSGLFYVADRHFQLFFEESTKSDQAASIQLSASTIDSRAQLALDRSTVTALLRAIYPQRKKSPPSDVSAFVEEISRAGYTDLATLEHTLRENEQIMLDREAVSPPVKDFDGDGSPISTEFTDVGAARTTLSLIDLNYRIGGISSIRPPSKKDQKS
jgi:putative GTP pyrophosphokinase